MARPTRLNWINEGVNELAKVLRAAPEFMHPDALTGAKGVVVSVEEHELDRAKLDRNGVVYCAIRYEDRRPMGQFATPRSNEYLLHMKVTLEAKIPADASFDERKRLWTMINRASSTINFIVNREVGDGSRRFAQYSALAQVGEGKATDYEDEESYYAIDESSVRLHVELLDYE